MPDLSSLDAKNSVRFVGNQLFIGSGPKDPRSFALITNFIRLVDKLVVDYKQSHSNLTDFVNTPNNNHTSPLIYATNYSESCITTMHRASEYQEKIRRVLNGPSIKKTEMLSESVRQKVSRMRNAIEHLDRDSAKNSWVPNQPICLMLKSDRLELSGEEIQYSELAEWVIVLNNLAMNLAQWNQP